MKLKNSAMTLDQIISGIPPAIRAKFHKHKIENMESLLNLTADDIREMGSVGPRALMELRRLLWLHRLLLNGDRLLAVIGDSFDARNMCVAGDIEQ